jgi:hypothetical protein
MPLPDMSSWEHDPTPEPALGMAFFCLWCGEICGLTWGDWGVGVPGPREHRWGWRSDCCQGFWHEDNKKE